MLNENVYIEIYEENNNTGVDILDSLLAALERLKKDRISLESNTERFGLVSKMLRKSFFQRGQYNPEITKMNLEIIGLAMEKLQALKETSKPQNSVEEAQFRKAILDILNEDIKNLPDSSKTRQFFKYVTAHLISIDFSARESSLIKPSIIEIHCEGKETYPNGKQWTPPAIQDLLNSKEIPEDIFDSNQDSGLTLESDITEHTQWAFDHVYQYAYPDTDPEDNLARFHHGIEHVARAALYARVFANLYSKHGDEAAQNLTEEDIKLIQIALLFHDSAREDEGEDRWDHESALFLYCYLTRVLHLDPQVAKLCAEATANKDPSPEHGYFEIIENEEGELKWQFNTYEEGVIPPKNIFQKIIHDCDCLDIIRARNQFDARYLDFYKEIASKKGNEIALEEMAELVIETRSLIAIQGDLHIKPNAQIKTRYENREAYSRITADLDPDAHKIINALSDKLIPVDQLQQIELVDLTPFDRQSEMTPANLRAALREGKVFARAIYSPSASPKPRNNKEIDADETMAEKEIRKTMRVKDINTRSRKEGPRDKDGNPFRSVSILGGGSGTYAPAGMLIFDPDPAAVKKVSAEDFDSGRGKKTKLIALKQEKEYPASSESVVPAELTELQSKIKLGLYGKKGMAGSNYAELLYDITQYSAIFYSPDPTIANEIAFGDFDSAHKYSPLLQAVYLLKQYETQYDSTREEYIHKYGEKEGLEHFIERFGTTSRLPLYEHSGLHNRLTRVDHNELTEEKIIQMWLEMCSDYMRENLNDPDTARSVMGTIYHQSIDDIKIASMYKVKINKLAKQNQSADINYPDHLKEAISRVIENEKQRLIEEHEQNLLEKMHNNELSMFSEELFLNLQYSPRLREDGFKFIKEQLDSFLSSDNDLYSRFLKDLTFSNSWNIVSIDNLNDIAQLSMTNKKIILENKLLMAYILAKQSGLDSDVSVVQKEGSEIASEMISRWRASGVNDVAKLINLNTAMKLIDSGERVGHDIELLVADYVEKRTELFVAEKCSNISDYCKDVISLHTSSLLNLKQLDVIKKGFNSINQITNWGDLITYLNLGHLLKENVLPGFDIWLKSKDQALTIRAHEIINTLKGHIIFNEEHLGRFEALVGKIHFADHTTNYPSFSCWMKVMNHLETLVEGNQFSESQLDIIKKRFDSIAAIKVKQILAPALPFRYSGLNENEKQISNLVMLSAEINTILEHKFYFPVPECLEQNFNTILAGLFKEPFIDFKHTQGQIDAITQIHEQLPNKEIRQGAIQKLIEYSKMDHTLDEKTEKSTIPGLK